jgi:hypothetical protein
MRLHQLHYKFHVVRILSHTFPIQNGLNQGDDLSSFRFNFALEPAIRKVQESQEGLELNRTHKLFVNAADINLLGDSVSTIKENTESISLSSRYHGLEISAEKTKYMIMSRYPKSRGTRL